jgi:hypothetical protein
MKKLAALGLIAFLSQTRTLAQGPAPTPKDVASDIGLRLIYGAVAAAMFFVAFKAADWATPGDLKQQLADGNTAMAVFVSGLCIASAIIIAALVG